MRKPDSCLKLLCVLLLASICTLLVVLPFVNAADDQSASLPPRSVGDEWKFVVDYKGDMGMICNMTTTVTGTSVLPGNYECYEFTSVGNGVVYGENVSGNWSMTIKEYYGKSDFNLAKMTITKDVTAVRSNGSSTTSQYTEINNNPPFGMNSGFPLMLGKTWSATTNTTQTNTLTVDGQTSQDNSTFTQTTNFEVASVEDTQTQAGTFQTFLIRGTAVDGSIQDMYYAPDAHIQVKELDYDSAGNLAATMELTDYQVAEPADAVPIYWIVIAIIGAAVAVGAVSFLT